MLLRRRPESRAILAWNHHRPSGNRRGLGGLGFSWKTSIGEQLSSRRTSNRPGDGHKAFRHSWGRSSAAFRRRRTGGYRHRQWRRGFRSCSCRICSGNVYPIALTARRERCRNGHRTYSGAVRTCRSCNFYCTACQARGNRRIDFSPGDRPDNHRSSFRKGRSFWR